MTQPPNQPPYGQPGQPGRPQSQPGRPPMGGPVPPQGAPRPPQGYPQQGPGPQGPAPQFGGPQGGQQRFAGQPGPQHQGPQHQGPPQQPYGQQPRQHQAPSQQQYGQPPASQHQAPQPGQPYQQGGAQAPVGAGGPGGQGAVIDAKFFPLSWFFFFVKPKIFINGQQVPAVWKQNVIPLAPGRYHVHMHVPYFLPPKVGPVDSEVVVNPGQFTPLEYRAPVWTFSKGSLGPAPQKYNGMGALIAMMVVPIVLMVLLFVIVFASAM